MMAPVRWSNLPADILSHILKLLNSSNVDLLRLRSVCPYWRSSLPPPKNPVSFPLNLPPLSGPPESPFHPGIPREITLTQVTFYRLSSPATGSHGYPTKGWLFKVSQMKPNTFSILNTMTRQKITIIPNHLNLLEYRISEISKSYTVDFDSVDPRCYIKKVIGLWNYVSDCEFAALVLRIDGGLSYWKLGDRDWAHIDSKGYEFDDVILYDGKCYAVDGLGVLVSFDSKMNMSVVVSSKLKIGGVMRNYLVESESDLYVVSKIHPHILDFYYQYLGKGSIEEGTPDDVESDFGLMLVRLDKCNGKWGYIGGLGDKAFVLCEDSSLSVCAKDIQGCTENSVYLSDWCFVDESNPGEMVGFYRMDGRREFILTRLKDSAEICSPPPSWLYV